ncbi:MAG: tRNA threonylcarbamoyladenosine biosynthesis protein TsaE [Phenylobacterium sp.]|jgi:tRNA threonylcarbamoyladenosine biosynthesis protein TsaE
MQYQQTLADEAATVAFGETLAKAIDAHINGPLAIYLNGDLGAGKTTLTRGIVTGFGHQGRVKSPTYTLVEPYELEQRTIYHFDLYRLGDPEELEFMGIRDYFANNAICVIEWPQRGEGFLPIADISVDLLYLEHYRQITLNSYSPNGDALIKHLDNF